MKLTKAQRLFMKAGAADRKLRVCEKTFKQFCEDAKAAPHAWSGITRKHKQLRARRKRLIREALEAATEEYWNAYEDGEKEGIAKATLGCSYYQ